MNDEDAQRLLIVEDEDHLAAGLKLNLELEGYRVDVASNAREAGQRLLDPSGYDAIVLDVMLPDVNGFDLCKKFREAGNFVPVIMLTARSSPEDRVLGLEAGADDYMVKPFELGELLARVRSVLRRQHWEQVTGNSVKATTLSFGEAEINFDTHEVTVSGEEVAAHATRARPPTVLRGEHGPCAEPHRAPRAGVEAPQLRQYPHRRQLHLPPPSPLRNRPQLPHPHPLRPRHRLQIHRLRKRGQTPFQKG